MEGYIMTNTMNIDFKFRTKFEKLIRNDEHRQAFMAAFNKFCSQTPLEAINYLWRLTYYSGADDSNGLDETAISILLMDLYLDYGTVSLSEILNLRNELRYQYELQNPDFLKVDMDEKSKKAFTELSKKSDSITATIVYEHCISFQCLADEDMSRILFLLNNSKESNFFGGIRSLYFTKKEAIYLKPFHTQIHDLLKAVYEFYKENNSPKNKPLQELDAMLENAGIKLTPEDDSDLPFVWGNEDIIPDNSIDNNADNDSNINSVDSRNSDTADNCNSISEFKTLTSENVLEYKNVFASFVFDHNISSLEEILNLRFDLNQVIAKQQEIANLLIADKALNS